MSTIRCTVSNCRFWSENNVCTAEQILVTAPASSLPAVERHGMGAERLHTTPIQDYEDSLCYTFEARA